MCGLWKIGRANAHIQFSKSILAWNEDRSVGTRDMEIPQHLKSVRGFYDPTVIRDLHVSMEMADKKRELEALAGMLA